MFNEEEKVAIRHLLEVMAILEQETFYESLGGIIKIQNGLKNGDFCLADEKLKGILDQMELIKLGNLNSLNKFDTSLMTRAKIALRKRV